MAFVNLAKAKGAWDETFDGMKKTLSRTPVTTNTDNTSGDDKLVEGTPVNIEGLFYRKEDGIQQTRPGLLQNADALLIVATTTTIARNDKITYDSQNYRILDVPVTRRLGTQAFYIFARCFKI